MPGVHHITHLSRIHTSVAAGGLEEFFDDPKNWGQPVIKAGTDICG